MKKKSKSCKKCRHYVSNQGLCPFPWQTFLILCRLIGGKALRKTSLSDVYDDAARFTAKRCPLYEEGG